VKYLSLEQVALLHKIQINKLGGSNGIRDIRLLESSIMRPQVSFGGEDIYKTAFQKAAVLTHSIIKNHPFIDGNKRTGMYAALTFLEINGHHVKLSTNKLVEFGLGVATNKISDSELASIFEKKSKSLGVLE